MKFTCKVDINAPRDKVVAMWNDEKNLSKWQEGFLRYEHLKGEILAVGSQGKLFYKQGKNEFELLETILISNLPEEMKGKYDHIKMSNTMHNKFTVLPNNGTRWQAEIEYGEMRGFMMNFFKLVMPSMFKKQTQKWLDNFKNFVEESI